MAAPGRVAIEVDGLDELRREIRRIHNSELGKELRSANKTLAQRVIELALPNVPVRTGRLKASVKAMSTQAYALGKAGSPARVPYAPAIHWGWPGHHIAGRPFLYEAGQRVERGVVDDYAKAVDRILDRVRHR